MPLMLSILRNRIVQQDEDRAVNRAHGLDKLDYRMLAILQQNGCLLCNGRGTDSCCVSMARHGPFLRCVMQRQWRHPAFVAMNPAILCKHHANHGMAAAPVGAMPADTVNYYTWLH